MKVNISKLSSIILQNAVWVIQTAVRKKRAIVKKSLEMWKEIEHW